MNGTTQLVVTLGVSGTAIIGTVAALLRVSYSLGRETKRSDELEKSQTGIRRCVGEMKHDMSEFRSDISVELSVLSQRTAVIEEAVTWIKEKNGG